MTLEIDRSALRPEPLSRASTIPSAWYVDPRHHRLDREAIFRRHWHYVAHESELRAPGSWVTAQVAGNPIVVVRDGDSAVRAFYNVCPHRGGPLALGDRGCSRHRVLQCEYHGWTFRLDGALRGVPSFDRVELFDRDEHGLEPIRLESWEGLHFVRLEDGEQPGLAEALAGIAERIDPVRLPELEFRERQVYDIDCNWKVYADNYLEGYHIPLVHPDLLDILDYRAYRTEAAGWYSLQTGPFRDDSARYGVSRGEAFYYYAFPNLALNVMPGRLQTNLVVPVAPDRTRVIFDYFYADVGSAQARAAIEEDLAFGDRVQREDIRICESVQRGLASEAYDRGRFSVDMEACVHHFQERVKKAYSDWLGAPA